jgi:hypothetical protein
MSKLRNLEETLIEKLNEWATDKHSAEILVDTFLAAMDAEEWDSDDKIRLLENAKGYFKKGGGRSLFIYEVVDYECMAIKVNEGY